MSDTRALWHVAATCKDGGACGGESQPSTPSHCVRPRQMCTARRDAFRARIDDARTAWRRSRHARAHQQRLRARGEALTREAKARDSSRPAATREEGVQPARESCALAEAPRGVALLEGALVIDVSLQEAGEGVVHRVAPPRNVAERRISLASLRRALTAARIFRHARPKAARRAEADGPAMSLCDGRSELQAKPRRSRKARPCRVPVDCTWALASTAAHAAKYARAAAALQPS